MQNKIHFVPWEPDLKHSNQSPQGSSWEARWHPPGQPYIMPPSTYNKPIWILLLHLPPLSDPSIMGYGEALYPPSLTILSVKDSILSIFAFFPPYPNIPCIKQNHNKFIVRNELKPGQCDSVVEHLPHATRGCWFNSQSGGTLTGLQAWTLVWGVGGSQLIFFTSMFL